MGDTLFSKLRPVAALIGLGIVAGCTSGNGALEPGFTSANLNANKLQLAVGVATYQDGTTGLNTVTTFRQPDGLVGTLLNTPTLTGPFTVPAGVPGTRSAATTTTFGTAICAANVDAGTNHITGSPQVTTLSSTAVCTTLGQAGGVTSYGIAPTNSTTASAPAFLLYGDFLDGSDGAIYGNPFYSNGTDYIGDGAGDENTATGSGYAALRGGPPSYPNVRNGTYPTGFLGYTFGYTTFHLTPVAGAYNLTLNIQAGDTANSSISAPTATLSSTVGLPAYTAAPTFAEDGTGGGTASCTSPAGVTETVVELFDEKTDAYYTKVVSGGGLVSAGFTDALGPAPAPKTAATLNTGDAYEVVCIGADYPLYEAGPPNNLSQTPTIVGASGQADITFSPPDDATYGGVVDDSKTKVHRVLHMHKRA
jgi:hypothetical protein